MGHAAAFRPWPCRCRAGRACHRSCSSTGCSTRLPRWPRGTEPSSCSSELRLLISNNTAFSARRICCLVSSDAFGRCAGLAVVFCDSTWPGVCTPVPPCQSALHRLGLLLLSTARFSMHLAPQPGCACCAAGDAPLLPLPPILCRRHSRLSGSRDLDTWVQRGVSSVRVASACLLPGRVPWLCGRTRPFQHVLRACSAGSH